MVLLLPGPLSPCGVHAQLLVKPIPTRRAGTDRVTSSVGSGSHWDGSAVKRQSFNNSVIFQLSRCFEVCVFPVCDPFSSRRGFKAFYCHLRTSA